MKNIRPLAMSIVLFLMTGLSACGTYSEKKDSQSISLVSTAEIDTNSSDEPMPETDSGTELPTEAEILLDENGEPLYISADELDPNLKDKIYKLLNAVAVHDEELYLNVFDVEEYVRTKYNISEAEPSFESQCSYIREEQTRYFHELSEAFSGDFRGSIENIHIEGTSQESYYLSFSTEADNGRLIISGEAVQKDDIWSVELSLWNVISHAYYDYEPLIVKEMLAAAHEDKEIYMECVDMDLLNDVNVAMLLGEGTLSADEFEKARMTMQEYTAYDCDFAYEELSSVLGENFDGKVLQVQYFSKAEGITIPDGELYGRILLTVRNAENEYQEVEGYAYTINGKKGVFLQPD